MNYNKLMSFLGLAKKANRLSLGNDTVVSSLKAEKSNLILVSCDVSERSENKFKSLCDSCHVPFFKLNLSMEQIQTILGKKCGVISINDVGFSSKIIGLVCDNNKEEDNL